MRPNTVRALTLVFLLLALVSAGTAAPEKGPAQIAPEDVNELSMDVAALEMLHKLQVTPAQLELLAKMRVTLAKGEPRQPAKVSPRYRQTLVELRAAHIRVDEKKIDELNERLDELQDKEDPDLDDGVEISADARGRAATVLRWLSPRQLSNYLADREEVHDPVELLVLIFERGKKRSGAVWDALKEQGAEEVAAVLAGVRESEYKEAVEKITTLLDMLRAKNMDAEKARKAIEKLVEKLTGSQSGMDLLKNVVERDLAELLSNPRLNAAVKARLAGKP